MWAFIKSELHRLKNTCIWSWEGWWAAWETEKSLRQWSLANVISASLTFVFPLSVTQQALIIGLGMLVLAAELINSAIEEVVDMVSPERHPKAKRAKDMGSGAVAVTALAAGVAWVIVLVGVYSG